MTATFRCCAALAGLLFAAPRAYAGPCEASIASVQARVDAAIEREAGSSGWRPESLDALRGYQPTPRSLAQAEGRNGFNLQIALDSLDRARAADRAGDTAACRRQLASVKRIIRQQRR
ncbi:hypothetical protein ACVMHW_004848 [Bradyrhizobium diazoefficiens]